MVSAKKSLTFWVASLLLICIPALALAQRRDNRPSRKMSKEEFERRLKREGDGYFARYDRNRNGTLEISEVSSRLRREMKRYDRNRDGKISRSEYTPYIRAYLEQRYGMKSNTTNSSAKPGVASVDLGILDRRPLVYRAGNVPEDLPDWFKEFDDKEKGGDGDGQIGLYEWRTSKNDLDEFNEYDRNRDGFVTVEEMLYHNEYVVKAGFTQLGKDLTHWQVDVKQAKAWKMQAGAIHHTGRGGRNLRTSKKYGDFEMWVDWKITRGGDSGIYPRGVSQIQIWDRKEGSGGLYYNKKGTPGQKPLVAADNPPGKWNRFHIKMVGDKVTVELNGKIVVDNAQMTNRNGDVPKTGVIELQTRGSPLWFRNIYIKELDAG